MNWFTVVSFIWNLVYPNLKEIINVIGKDAYGYIADKVDDVEIMELDGVLKRSRVYSDTVGWLEDKGIDDLGVFGATAIYVMIEIAVLNMKRNNG